MEEIFLLDIPNFQPKYKNNISYSYKNNIDKNNLKELLTEESIGHCMYCYTKIFIDGKNFGQLEHSIEKSNSEEILTDCISNISIACSVCNTSFKRKGEKKRQLSTEDILFFEENTCCEKSCIAECESYKNLKRKYLDNESSDIILQPFGVKNNKTGNNYRI